MNAIDFQESNRTLKPPQGMTDNCNDLQVYTNGAECISLWELNEEDLERIALTGKLWLRVMSGETQPPIQIQLVTPFVHGGN